MGCYTPACKLLVGSKGMLLQENVDLRCSEMLFPSFWGHIFSFSPNNFEYVL